MNDHRITPPPELVQQWRAEWRAERLKVGDTNCEQWGYATTQAARWGSDQELNECCHLLRLQGFDVVDDLRAARRPKPPSLKERALQAWVAVEAGTDDQAAMAVIRRALEQLDD